MPAKPALPGTLVAARAVQGAGGALFVPLTLGLSWVLVICESVYVMTGRQIYRDMTRADAIAAAQAQAVERAVAAGADRASLATVDVEDMPLAYLPGNALRVRVRVAGEMRGAAG